MKTNWSLTSLITLFCAGALAASAAPSLLDTTFDPGTGANGLVESFLVLPSGKILICGNFTSYDGTNANYMARLNTDGTLDTSFQPAPSYWVRTMALQSDGKIVIGGFFKSVSGVPRNLVARLNSDGSLDTSFDPGSGATGTLGGAINGNNDPFIFATAVQSDGKILITGNFKDYDGASRWGIARVNSDGSLDTLFDVGSGFNTNSWGRSLLIQPNGQIMVTGWFTSYNNHNYNRMVLLNTDGSADTSFNPFFGDLTAIYGVQRLSSGDYIVVGDSENTNLFRQDMARLKPDGSFDTSFVGAANDKTESVRIQSDGKILIGGYFSMVDGTRQLNLARLNADGSFDTNFTPSVDNFVWSMAIQPDNKILIVGGFQNVEGVSRNGVARLLPSTSSSGGGGTGPGGGSTPTFAADAGNYQGLFFNEGSFTNSDAGFISTTVGPHGGYTARVNLDGILYAWSGILDTNGAAAKTIRRPVRGDVNINLGLAGNNTVSGTVATGTETANITAYRASFSRTNPASFAGHYTAVFGAGSSGAPAGDGRMVINVDVLGNYSMTGRLADGATYNRSGHISDNGLVPFFMTYRARSAAAAGWISLDPNVQSTVYWENGFNTTLPVTVASYTPSGRASPLTLTNGVITVSGGDLTNAISVSFTLNPRGNFVFAPGSNTNRFHITLTRANGAFNGEFFDPVTHRFENFYGVVLQGQNSGAGYFGSAGGAVTLGSP